METRRDFLKKAALYSTMAAILPESVKKAFAIDPAPGSTYLDAEHVVILMQENRSFDHAYGSLQGVRGFNDPRAITKPDNNLVWLQRNAAGETFAPFRLNIKDTNATWLGSLPHSWTNQVDARNDGRYDRWLEVKPSGYKGFAGVPLTMGYYNREDLPFYYALADAFTICDQNFCSSLTGTTPNRLYLWSGTVRAEQRPDSFAHLRNEDAVQFAQVKWPTFPERLEENNISWKIYQNEIDIPTGMTDDEAVSLSNFSDNPIEFFEQYNVYYSPSYHAYLQSLLQTLPGEIAQLNQRMITVDANSREGKRLAEQLAEKKLWLKRAQDGADKYTAANFANLSQHARNLHEKAFTNNRQDPNYRRLDTLTYKDGDQERQLSLPKGDLFYQFRQDVDNNALPTVSWLVAPENFSDHPSAPWYGAWYVAEAMDILTKRPEVWKKTIFILCYDENDGYFDHQPPFVAPNPDSPASGLVSKSVDARSEFVTLAQDMTRYPKEHSRESAIGLGFRVPLVIASPWSRGGAVCSQVFDHTSIIQFLEHFVSEKTGKRIYESNITGWRRTVCGDLRAVFRPFDPSAPRSTLFSSKDTVIQSVYNAKFKQNPTGYRALNNEEIDNANSRTKNSVLPRQEPGTRLACALPYELYADGWLNPATRQMEFTMSAAKNIFKERSAGSPFNIYAGSGDKLYVRNYAVAAGESLQDHFGIDAGGPYLFQLNGPNGFYRSWKGVVADPPVKVSARYEVVAKKPVLVVEINTAGQAGQFTLTDNAYKQSPQHASLPANHTSIVRFDLSASKGWYDISVSLDGNTYLQRRFAGHVETGEASSTDPAMAEM